MWLPLNNTVATLKQKTAGLRNNGYNCCTRVEYSTSIEKKCVLMFVCVCCCNMSKCIELLLLDWLIRYLQLNGQS